MGRALDGDSEETCSHAGSSVLPTAVPPMCNTLVDPLLSTLKLHSPTLPHPPTTHRPTNVGKDTYRNLPSKTLQTLRYALSSGCRYTHVMKADDDVHLRPQAGSIRGALGLGTPLGGGSWG